MSQPCVNLEIDGVSWTHRLFVDLPETKLTANDVQILSHPAVGGVVLFARNTVTAEQTAELCISIREVRQDLIISVDQEGGRVQRLRDGVQTLPPASAFRPLYEQLPDFAIACARSVGMLMASELLGVGVDFSFAPVLDIDYGHNTVIADRSFGTDPHMVVALAGAWIEGVHSAGMACVGKHFPGHGYVSADSHIALPRDNRSLDELEHTCLHPFRALVPHLEAIMPAHVIYESFDDMPAGFSKRWHEYLRTTLAFRGIAISDDLAMAGAAIAGDMTARATQALGAGCDIVLVCNDRNGLQTLLEAIDTRSDTRTDTSRVDHLETLRRSGVETADNSSELSQAQHIASLLVKKQYEQLLEFGRPMSWDKQ
ncbi:MAG: beta-N-acetylhexosaminidase [Spirochaetaceae bacterium]|nr:MAG: beta-N-acetylhexosaminidase [Spirochaetaceae bacterium]